jgi:hypothetical protein
MLSKFYTKAGMLTPYALACGYVEVNKEVVLSRENSSYVVKGFHNGLHIFRNVRTLTEARQILKSYN